MSSTSESSPVITAPASIAAYNRGPITEIFTPPTSCLKTLTMQEGDTGFTDLVLGHWLSGDPACYPPGTLNPDQLLSSTSWLQWYYSPAVCPSGWTVAETITSTMSEYGISFLSIGSSTTAALCCPSGWGYFGDDKACSALLAEGAVITYVNPSNASYSSGMSYTEGDFSTTTMASAYTIFADGVPIMYQESDSEIPALWTSLTQIPTSTAAPSSTSGSTSAPTSSSPASTSSTSTHPPSGLSTGAKIAIGVTIPAVAIALILGIFLFFRRRKRTNNQVLPVAEGPAARPPGGPGAPAAELAADSNPQLTSQRDYTPVMSVPQIRNDDNYDMSATVDFQHYNELEAPYHGAGYGYYDRKGHLAPSNDYTLVPSHDQQETSSSNVSPNLTNVEPASTNVSAQHSPVPALAAVRSSHEQEPVELASHSQPASPRISVSEVSRSASPNPSTTPSSNSNKLDVLRDRIDRVRAEKERLSRIGELDQLEKDLQKEILDAQRRELEENR